VIEWEYEYHPNRATVESKCAEMHQRALTCKLLKQSIVEDTRPSHEEIFSEVVPLNAEHFAGSYRGANYPYLIGYGVRIGRYIGTQPNFVAKEMRELHQQLVQFGEKYKEYEARVRPVRKQKIALLARMVSEYIVWFLSIHPYANGNGHMSRLLALVLFDMQGLQISGWDLDERPEKPFDDCIVAYREGDPEPLTWYFYERLVA